MSAEREQEIATNSLEEKHRRMLKQILEENPKPSEVLDLMADICDEKNKELGGQSVWGKAEASLWWGAQVHIYHAARLIEMAGL